MFFWLLRLIAVAVTLKEEFPSGWYPKEYQYIPMNANEQKPSSYG